MFGPTLSHARLRRRATVVIALAIAAGGAVLASGGGTASAANFSVIRINAGGAAFTDSQGRAWDGDEYFSDDGWTYDDTSQAIAGAAAADQTLYNTERSGMSSYRIPVTNGTYTVKLYLAEIYPESVASFLQPPKVNRFSPT